MPKNYLYHHGQLRHNPLNCIGISSSLRCSEKSTSQLTSSQPSLSLCTMNVRSIKNKSAVFVDYVNSCKADLFALTETWLGKNDDAHRQKLHLLASSLSISGVTIVAEVERHFYLKKIWIFKQLQRRNFVHLNICSSLFHLAPLKFVLPSLTAHRIRLHTLSPQPLFSLTLRTIWKP